MRIVRHPLVDQDLAALVDHIVDIMGGDFAAVGKRLDQVDELTADISANAMSGVRLAEPLDGWLVPLADAAIAFRSCSAPPPTITPSLSH